MSETVAAVQLESCKVTRMVKLIEAW